MGSEYWITAKFQIDPEYYKELAGPDMSIQDFFIDTCNDLEDSGIKLDEDSLNLIEEEVDSEDTESESEPDTEWEPVVASDEEDEEYD